MSSELGNKLKELRESSSLTGKEVSAKLKESGFEISDKTLYGYESGIRMPNADVFMQLCQIYGCKNILETFGDVGIDYSIPDDKEWAMIEKYRTLDSYGSDLVDTVLDKEYERCQEQEEYSIPMSDEELKKLPLDQVLKIEPYIDNGMLRVARKRNKS